EAAARLWGEVETTTGYARAWAGVQLLLLLLPTIGVTYTMVRTARRSCTSALRWSAGSPPRRMSVVTGSLLLVGALAFAWWPDGRLSPYRPGESGTVQQQARELPSVRPCTPLLRSPPEAQHPL